MQPEHGDEETKEFPFEEEEPAGEGTEVTDDEEEDIMIGDEPDSKAVPPPRATRVAARPAPKKTAKKKKAKAKPSARKKATAKKSKKGSKLAKKKTKKNKAKKTNAKKTKSRGKRR